MFRTCFAAAPALLVLLSAGPTVRAQETAELFDVKTGIRSKVTITQEELQIAAEEGVIYIYDRDTEHDGPGSYCYYNATLDQALRWPLDRKGALQILKPGAARYQRSEMQIANRRGAIGGDGNTAPSGGLDAYLNEAVDGGGELHGQLQFAHVHPIDDGVFNAEFFSWEQGEYEYTVEVPVIVEVVVNGRVKQVEETRTEVRTTTGPTFGLSTLTLSFEQMTAFLPNGTELGAEALLQLLGEGAPAVMVPDMAQGDDPHLKLDAHVVKLLQPGTPIIVYDSAAEPSPRALVAPGEAGKDFPMTPIEFGGATADGVGGIELVQGVYEMQERIVTVKVPMTETRIVNGREVNVTVFVEEQQTRSIPVWNLQSIALAADDYELYELLGKPLTSVNAVRRLHDPQTVIFVGLGQELDPWYRKVLRARTLLVASKAPEDVGSSPFADPDHPRMRHSGPAVHSGIVSDDDQLFERFAQGDARALVGEYSQLNPENDWHSGAISVAGRAPGGGLKLLWTNRAGVSWGLTPDLPNRVLKCGPDNPYHEIPESRAFDILLGQNANGEPVVAGFHFQDKAAFVRQDSLDAATQLNAEADALKRPDGNHAEAIVKFQEAIRLNPLFIAAHHGLGIALREMGRPTEALVPLSAALELYDGDAMIWYNRAFANLDSGESEAALNDIAAAISIRPDDAGFYYLQSSIFDSLGETNKANAARRQAKRLEAAAP